MGIYFTSAGIQRVSYFAITGIGYVLMSFFFQFQSLHAEKYVLYLDAKPTASLPALSIRSIERRKQQGIALDALDLPVSTLRIQEILANADIRLLGQSRWLNAVWIETPLSADAIRNLFPWHQGLETPKLLQRIPSSYSDHKGSEIALSANSISNDYGFAGQQNNQIGMACMHNQGYRGENVIISVFDSGFRNVDQITAFDSMRLQNRLLYTRDFVDNESNVFDDDSHGTLVLSTMAARRPLLYSGSAWKASYILARTETIFSETPAEEFNWLMAMEWVDSIGTDIIQSSLGYNSFDGGMGNYVYNDLDGKTSIISRAAATAVSRGIMVVVSAGNEGSNSWGYITVPADADSILAVGSVAFDGERSGFSSYGPTPDGRIKPDVMATGEGTSVFSTSGAISSSNGTSFSAPLIAGLTACLRQAHPQVPAWIVMDAVRKTANKASQPDNLYGYGIANACAADSMLQLFTNVQTDAINKLVWSVYPNPASDVLNIQANPGYSDANWFIFNVEGRLMMQGSGLDKAIPVQMLSSGHYWIQVTSGTVYDVQQWVKE